MTSKRRVAVVGSGHVGREALAAIRETPDLEAAGVVLRDPARLEAFSREVEAPTALDVDSLGPVDVAVLAIASRAVPEVAPSYLARGICTVDSFDIHGDAAMELRQRLDVAGRGGHAAAVICAGWDPGTDSVVRALLECIAPRGITYTNFGPGMSMGHTVAVKALPGVKDALSLTLPQGTGIHKRHVYVTLQEGADFEEVRGAILADPYFRHDECHVFPAEDIRSLLDLGHGVHMERKGVAGRSHNQRMEFSMSVMNPAATAQVMVSAARAALRQKPGSYTMLEIPLLDFLPGDRDALLRRLV
ncbi:MAG TPA: diaminopimelate dehydrogenase [Synergistaceae bacterium]|nr:diaminopimelate dehydrogenase [Synergistaceae bacterium]HQF91451.1 diaminopimelate dehydrogenase [Synergistaceae bacterium]HQH78477.1 diaminopimelate dehydrogenase [Synergistaceae bacterium]HQK25077.1 diaminopimelate dehydrogenase [Synergistaceae bacterium]